LSQALLEEFKMTLLPTEDPFTILFIRTVHGLALDDLDSIRRYRAEMNHLSAEERTLIMLDADPDDSIYRFRREPPASFIQGIPRHLYPNRVESQSV
jgi:hypothetical protein